MQIKMLNTKMKKACIYHKTFFFKKDPIKNSHDSNLLLTFSREKILVSISEIQFSKGKENISIELFSTG